ncbi:uncharacterized protein ARMOST_16689 [Armillaria ostoyae]|uniref:Uncharacterized protein n=1 Tax=Armillaria ostoyae TaxID=47428 RepID=A0A284RWX0_ARMOS|nr:uncharacterized protein ARMOST_16689 [Armillaria ostoyae]
MTLRVRADSRLAVTWTCYLNKQKLRYIQKQGHGFSYREKPQMQLKLSFRVKEHQTGITYEGQSLKNVLFTVVDPTVFVGITLHQNSADPQQNAKKRNDRIGALWGGVFLAGMP